MWERLLDFFLKGLKPFEPIREGGKDTNDKLSDLVVHRFLAMLVLALCDDRRLHGGGHIVVAGGNLYGRNIPSKFMGKSIKRTLLKFFRGKGLGAVADEVMFLGDIAGIYVCSRVSGSDDQPDSRFTVKVIGGEEPYLYVSRFTSRMTVRWYTDTKSSCGPFVNAPSDGDIANCILDTTAFWEDVEDTDLGRALVIFALIVDVERIEKGEEVLWKYKPFALKGRMVPEGY